MPFQCMLQLETSCGKESCFDVQGVLTMASLMPAYWWYSACVWAAQRHQLGYWLNSQIDIPSVCTIRYCEIAKQIVL